MAKLIDKFFNRVIEGELSDLSEKDGQEIGKVISGGTKLYLHEIVISNTTFYFVSLSNTPIRYDTSNELIYSLAFYNASDRKCIFDYDTDTIYEFLEGVYTPMEDVNIGDGVETIKITQL